jgi:murein DD-endopeptidase MepM/ murein hydrolase activator NlpD
LTVSVFHDRNGNETLEEGEAAVPGSVVSIADRSCTTDGDGTCMLDGISLGQNHLTVNTRNAAVKGLDYMFSHGTVLRPSDGLLVDIDEDTSVSIALGQGPLPLPMIAQQGFGGIYTGFMTPDSPTHDGLDLWVEGQGEQPILANIGGKIESVGAECNHVTILVRRPWGELNVGLGHLTRVVVEAGQQVEKGEVVGYVNPSLYDGTRQQPGTIEVACTTQPHVHYNVYGPGGTRSDWDWLDPARVAPEQGNPLPLFRSHEEAEAYRTR